jgi:RpiB/LacA/LacB family sugar-phosphate isomerase
MKYCRTIDVISCDSRVEAMRIALGSDHAGYDLKAHLASTLREWGHEVVDLGTDNATDSVDYPDFGAAVGRCVAAGDADLGVCICGSGIGIAIAANKVPGVRAATVHDVTSAHLAREHNHANVLCLGSRLTGPVVAVEALQAWLEATPGTGRHIERVEKITELDSLLVDQER